MEDSTDPSLIRKQDILCLSSEIMKYILCDCISSVWVTSWGLKLKSKKLPSSSRVRESLKEKKAFPRVRGPRFTDLRLNGQPYFLRALSPTHIVED